MTVAEANSENGRPASSTGGPTVREIMPAEPRAIVPLLPYQRDDVEASARFSWCCWSRQIGKSFTKSLRRLLRGLARRRNQIFLSASGRQSRELMLKAQQHCRALAIAAEYRAETAFEGTEYKHLEIRLPNGVRIIGVPANPHTVRGFTGDVLLDEFAMHRDDREIWAAVFPTILRDDGEIDIASTPKGPANLFAELRANESFRHSTVTLYDAIAQGLKIDAEQVRRSMNDDSLFRQEFLCEFLDEVGAFLTYEQIAGCEDATIEKPPDWAALERRAGDLFVGVDIGRRRDLTVVWVLGAASGNEQASAVTLTPTLSLAGRGGMATLTPSLSLRGRGGVLVTLGVIEMRGEPFRRQYEVLHRVMALPGLRRCCIDATGVGMALAEAAVEAFGESRVEAVTFTPAVKDRLATGLKRRFEDQTIRLPVDEVVRNDLHSVRWDVTAGGAGRFVVSGAGDSHADRFWALAMAVHAAEEAAPAARMEFASAGTLRFARDGIW